MPQPKQPRSARTRAATAAVAFGVYADLAANMYSATNSSPQTTELFAGERSETLWKYVLVGHGQAVVFGIIGSVLDRTLWPLIGTLSIGGIMHAMYSHALKAGQNKARPSNAATTSVSGDVGSVTQGRRRGSFAGA